MAGRGFDPLYLKTLPSIGVMLGTRSAGDGDEDGDVDYLFGGGASTVGQGQSTGVSPGAQSDSSGGTSGIQLLPNYDPSSGGRIEPLPNYDPSQPARFELLSNHPKYADRSGRGLGNGSVQESTDAVYPSDHASNIPRWYPPSKGVALNVNALGPVGYKVFKSGDNYVQVSPDQSTIVRDRSGNIIGGTSDGVNGQVLPTPDGKRGGVYVRRQDKAGYITKAYADGSVDVFDLAHNPVGSLPAVRKIQEPWGSPQTVTRKAGGAVYSTNQSFDVDNDGDASGPNHQSQVSTGETVYPSRTPYLSRSATPSENQGIGAHDFGFVLVNGKVIGAPYIDAGPSVGAEGSIALAREMGLNWSPKHDVGFDAGKVTTMSLPGTSGYYRHGMSTDEINAAAANIYNTYAAKHADELQAMGYPLKYNGPMPAPVPPHRRGRR